MDLSSWREFRKMDGQRSPCHSYKSIGVPLRTPSFPRKRESKLLWKRSNWVPLEPALECFNRGQGRRLLLPFPRRALSRNSFARYKRATTALLDDILRLAEQNLPLGLGANA